MLGTFVADTLLASPFASRRSASLVADTTGAAAAPGRVDTDGTARPGVGAHATETGRRVATEARLVVLGHGRRPVGGFLRPPTEQAPPPGRGAGGARSRDGLTGLADRATLPGASGRSRRGARRHAGSVAVVAPRPRPLQGVNNSMGHASGDGVLISVARAAARQRRRRRRPRGPVRRRRVPGPLPTRPAAPSAGRGLRRPGPEALATPILAWTTPRCSSTPRSASPLNTFGADDPTDLLAHAEAAMYQAKRRGGFGVETFGESLRIEVLDRMATEHSLHRALERSELDAPLPAGGRGPTGATTVGVEALIRWDHPEQGMVAPGRFIPVAEESGLIIPIGAWVLEQACHQLRDWHAGRRAGRSGSMEVNLSARQIDDPGIVATVERDPGPHRAPAGAPDARDHRERPDAGRRRRARRAPGPEGAGRARWPSTTSAPGTRRSATSSGSRSTS